MMVHSPDRWQSAARRVPEPASALLLALGACLAGAARSRGCAVQQPPGTLPCSRPAPPASPRDGRRHQRVLYASGRRAIACFSEDLVFEEPSQ
jgi:hypothetical protein